MNNDDIWRQYLNKLPREVAFHCKNGRKQLPAWLGFLSYLITRKQNLGHIVVRLMVKW